MIQTESSRSIGRSILALLAGFVLVVVLSLIIDVVLHAAGVFPPLGRPASDGPLLLATIYRTIYGIAGSYLTARLAPRAPMAHALIGGAIGLVLSIAGAVATWEPTRNLRRSLVPRRARHSRYAYGMGGRKNSDRTAEPTDDRVEASLRPSQTPGFLPSAP